MEENSEDKLVTIEIQDEKSIREVLDHITRNLYAVRVQLDTLSKRQDKHENLTADLIQLYKGATIIGKMTAWVVSIAGGIGILFTVFGDKK